jgi:hypothetical protein
LVVSSGISIVHKFGAFLWELISGQPQAKDLEGFELVLVLEPIVHFLLTQLIVQLLAI